MSHRRQFETETDPFQFDRNTVKGFIIASDPSSPACVSQFNRPRAALDIEQIEGAAARRIADITRAMLHNVCGKALVVMEHSKRVTLTPRALTFALRVFAVEESRVLPAALNLPPQDEAAQDGDEDEQWQKVADDLQDYDANEDVVGETMHEEDDPEEEAFSGKKHGISPKKAEKLWIWTMIKEYRVDFSVRKKKEFYSILANAMNGYIRMKFLR